MDIIILSQDKTVIEKVESIFVSSCKDKEGGCEVFNHRSGDDITTLGHYPTEERCKQVIADIFEKVKLARRMGEYVIYEMPEE